jgi:syntaxin 5
LHKADDSDGFDTVPLVTPRDPARSKGETRGSKPTQPSRFAQQASLIGKEINATSLKLAQLADRIRRSTGLFNDPSDEINRLTLSVKSDIAHLNGRLMQLQQVLEQNNASSGRISKSKDEHDRNVVGMLQKSLMQTTKGFGSVLKRRSAAMKARSNRRGRFGQTQRMNPLGKPRTFAANSFAVGAARPVGVGSALSTSDVDAARAHFGSFGAGVGARAGTGAGTGTNTEKVAGALPRRGGGSFDDLEGGGLGMGLTQRRLLVDAESHLTQRADAMVEVEKHIADLGSIFSRLSTMLAAQRDAVERIDDNVESSLESVQRGNSELLKYFDSVHSNRMLFAKVFAILITFIVFFITFVA